MFSKALRQGDQLHNELEYANALSAHMARVSAKELRISKLGKSIELGEKCNRDMSAKIGELQRLLDEEDEPPPSKPPPSKPSRPPPSQQEGGSTSREDHNDDHNGDDF